VTRSVLPDLQPEPCRVARPCALWPGVHFPAPTNGKMSGNKRLCSLIPKRWRRQVVIQGQHYWLPQ
jgi:hypothetical protein